MREMTLNVNGQAHDVGLDPHTPLVYALRNDLGLIGTRFGCGQQQCGACHVLVDGIVTASCELPVASAEGHAITTVESTTTRDSTRCAGHLSSNRPRSVEHVRRAC
jgi:aerobic-type carbon monoxide dehydrogenase small subunit (CoxS/CutS family)